MIVPPAAWAGGYEVSDDVLRALFIEIFMAIYMAISKWLHPLRDKIREGHFACLTRLHSFGEKTAILGCARRLA